MYRLTCFASQIYRKTQTLSVLGKLVSNEIVIYFTNEQLSPKPEL